LFHCFKKDDCVELWRLFFVPQSEASTAWPYLPAIFRDRHHPAAKKHTIWATRILENKNKVSGGCMTTDFAELAKDALPKNCSDWGSRRQISARNAFFDEVRKVLDTDTFEALERFRRNATTDESVAEALRLFELNVEQSVKRLKSECLLSGHVTYQEIASRTH
jgi:hypothetical protein